ncbi:acyltransferase family protein [Gordonia sp. NPDC003585]|uniref:acyltransferase family protein n=1 Tax=Gordonia sp. NPDC003585 TaxID=3154275 RepID=UPI0033BEC893
MPRPAHAGTTYLPALDGLRALAVAFVVLYHLHVPGFTGGLLGVGVFFTLSGYLITSLLLRSRERTGGFELNKFWLSRARRLLPALILVLVTSLAAAAIARPAKLGEYSQQALSASFYVNNWHNIAVSDDYFNRFLGPGPFDHLWSLSIEEQFYIVWPLLLLGLILLLRRRVFVTVAIIGLALISFLLLDAVAHAGIDNTRAYEGTDTRAGGLLLGAALAFWWPARPRTVTHNQRCVIDVIALIGLATIVHLVRATPDGAMSLYSSGIAVLTIATCAVLVATVVPETLVASALGIAPLRWIGERSYGIYLWHMPVIAFLPANVRVGHPVAAGTLVILATLLLSWASWRYVEDPIRRHGLRAAFSTQPIARKPMGQQLVQKLIDLLTRLLGVLTGLATRLEARGEKSPRPDAVESPVPVLDSDAHAPDADSPDTDAPDADRTDEPIEVEIALDETVAHAPDDGPKYDTPEPVECEDAEGSDGELAEDAPVSEPADAVVLNETADDTVDESDSEVRVIETAAVDADTDTGTDSAEPDGEIAASADPAPDTDPAPETDPAPDTVRALTDGRELETVPAGPPESQRLFDRVPRLAVSLVVVTALAVGTLVAISAIKASAPDDGGADPALATELAPTSPAVRYGPTIPVVDRRTRCRTVIHIGDSTSIGMNSIDTLPRASERITGRYQQVGARTVITDIVGARSSLETVNGEPNAATAIAGHLARGERGCWVMAMGINDTANIEVGGPGPLSMRIDRLLGPLKDQPVMWPTVITSSLNENPAYNNAAMRRFNRALVKACERYPNLRIYDWAAETKPSWFIDGIHYTAPGYVERAYRFSIALATVFPATDFPPATCLLRSSDVVAAPKPVPPPAAAPPNRLAIGTPTP